MQELANVFDSLHIGFLLQALANTPQDVAEQYALECHRQSLCDHQVPEKLLSTL